MKKISVIVPVYNAEKYVARCLDSILSQDYENLDVICVNDGSTDGSLQILQQYAEKDKRVMVFSQSNKGAAAARNLGLKEAQADYVSFVDADDFLESGLYRYFDELVADEDIFMFNGSVGNRGNFFGSDTFVREVKEGDTVTYRDFGGLFYGNSSACNKVFNLDFLRKNKISFMEGRIFEDIDFWFAALVEAKEIKVSYQNFYRYLFDNPNSVTKTYNRNIFGIFDIFDSMLKRAEKAGKKDYFDNALFQFQYEKGTEILKNCDEQYAPEFYQRLQIYLKLRQDKLVYEQVYQLLDYHLCHNILHNDYVHFKNTMLLPYQDFKYVKQQPQQLMFSLIVPVYNVEPYLDICLKSIINQTFKNFEVICVNDGSTDNSLQILEKHAAQDCRIKIINQENKGLGAARNVGVSQAQGKYLVFVDSDDWIRTDMLEILNTQLTKQEVEVCLIGYCNFFDQLKVVQSSGILQCRKKILQEYPLLKPLYFMLPCVSAWSKVVLRTFWRQEKMTFPENMYFEDMLPNAQLLATAGKIGICWHDLYYYRQRANSITLQMFSDKKTEDLFKCYEDTYRYLVNKKDYSYIKDAFCDYVAQCLDYCEPLIVADKKDDYQSRAKELLNLFKNK